MVCLYKIIPFIWHDINEEDTFFQTKNASVVIKNKQLIYMLKELEEKEIVEINEDIFLNYFKKEHVKKVILFLENNKLIKKSISKNIKFEKIILFCNDSDFSELFNYAYSKDFKVKVENSLLGVKENILDNCLLIVFLNPFHWKKYEEITELAKKTNVIVKMIFSYNHHTYLSNFYKNEWMNPCPMCFFSELESQLRGEVTENSLNFQTIIDLLYSKSEKFNIEYPLDRKNYIAIIYTLMKNLNPNLENCDLDEVLSINLTDCSINKDIAYHWGYCDCYE